MIIFMRMLRLLTHPATLALIGAGALTLGGAHYASISADLAEARAALATERAGHIRAMAALVQREQELSRLRQVESRARTVIDNARGTHADTVIDDLTRDYLDSLRTGDR